MQVLVNALHQREQSSLLAMPERYVLQEMARRMPSWVTPDHLTLLGLGSMLMAGVAFWAARGNPRALILVVVALALNWFGDSLDGTLARVRNRQRPRYGFYVDHVVDLIGTAFLLGGLALSGYMSPIIAIGLLAVYSMVEAEVYLATHVRGVFRMAFMRVGPTELRIILAIGAIYLLYKPWVTLAGRGPFLLFDVGGMVSIVGMVIALVVSALRSTRALYEAERLPN